MNSIARIFGLTKGKYMLLIVLVSTLFFIIPNTIYGLSDLQFIYASVLPILVFLLTKALGHDFKFSIVTNDFWLLFFIALGFLSFTWAIDGALVWYQGFGWIAYFFLMIICRSVFSNKQITGIFVGCLVGAFTVLLITQLVIFALYGIGDVNIWHRIFGRNGNYSSCLLVILYPYFLFQSGSSLLLKCIRIVGTILMLLVFYITTSKGIYLALPFIGLLWIRYNYPRQKKYINTLFCLGSLVWTIGLGLLATTDVLDNFYGLGLSTRAYMLKASYKIFAEDPIAGIGLGNWFLKAYNYGIEEIRYFGNSYYWIRYHSHNLFGRLLAEVGLMGLFSFLVLFGNVIRTKLFRTKELSHLEYASLSSVILYLLLSFFYNAPTFSLYTFSGIQFVAFASLGLLTVGQINRAGKTSSALILMVAVLATGWFAFSAYNNNYYHQAKRSIKEGNSIYGLELLESIYKPNWYTSQSYRHLIPFQMAQLASENGMKAQAILYYEEAVSKAPYNGEVLFEYGKLLVDNNIELDKAENMLLNIVKLQPNRHAVNFLLAKLYYNREEWDQSLLFINKLQGSSYYKSGEIYKRLIEEYKTETE